MERSRHGASHFLPRTCLRIGTKSGLTILDADNVQQCVVSFTPFEQSLRFFTGTEQQSKRRLLASGTISTLKGPHNKWTQLRHRTMIPAVPRNNRFVDRLWVGTRSRRCHKR